MRLSESLSDLIKNDVKFTSESSENEAKYISELRDAVLKKAESELKDAFIVSELEVKDNGGELEISVEKAEGEKCERCWAISKTVGQNSERPTLCSRCCENLK